MRGCVFAMRDEVTSYTKTLLNLLINEVKEEYTCRDILEGVDPGQKVDTPRKARDNNVHIYYSLMIYVLYVNFKYFTDN